MTFMNHLLNTSLAAGSTAVSGDGNNAKQKEQDFFNKIHSYSFMYLLGKGSIFFIN